MACFECVECHGMATAQPMLKNFRVSCKEARQWIIFFIIPYTLGGYDLVMYMIYVRLAVSGVIRPVVYLANC